MTEFKSFCEKKTVKKGDVSSRVFSDFLCTPANSSRLSLASSRTVRRACASIETVNVSYEEYLVEYSTYLLRKAQNRVLSQTKESKKENVKKCLVSLKWEFEKLIEKNLKLRRELVCFKSYLDVIRDASRKVEDGKKLLEALRESKFDVVLKGLSDSLDNALNQLHLVDIDKKLIEEMFEKRAWGSGCELEECLRKLDTSISKNKEQVSNIAEELKKLRQLWLENTIFRKKFGSLFKSTYDEILESNYNFCINAVKRALAAREKNIGDFELEFNMPELDRCTNVQELQQTLNFSKLESSITPIGSSTPQPENK